MDNEYSKMPVVPKNVPEESSLKKCLNLKKRIPLIETLANYSTADAVGDLIAGGTVAMTMLPQSIAYSVLAGINPQMGVNSTFVGLFVYLFFGTIREVYIGPSSLMAILTYEFTRDLTPDHVVLLGFISGLVEMLISVLRLGFMVEFISSPAFSGFSSASALIVIVSQLKGILGIKYKTRSFLENFSKIWEMSSQMHFADISLGVSSCILLLILRSFKDVSYTKDKSSKWKLISKISWLISVCKNAIIVVFFSFISYYYITHHGSPPFLLSESVDGGLPSFQLPPFSTQIGNKTISFFQMVQDLRSGIIIVPIVTVLVNISIGLAYSKGGTVRASHEIFTAGLCVFANSFFGSMPCAGAFTRSGLSSSSGVRTPAANFFCGVFVMLGIYFLSPYSQYIPRSTLSAVLIIACLFLVEVHLITFLWKTNKLDLVTFLATFTCCLTLGVEKGLLVGIFSDVSRLVYLWARPDLTVDIHDDVDQPYILVTPKIGFFFPSVNFLCKSVNKIGISNDSRPVVFDCINFKTVDYTAAKGLLQLSDDYCKRNQDIIFINTNKKIDKFCRKLGRNLKTCQDRTEVMKLFGESDKNKSCAVEMKIVNNEKVTEATVESQESDTLLSRKL